MKERGDRLRKKWKELLDADSEKGRKWKADVGKLQEEARKFQCDIDHDEDLRRVRRTHAKLGDDIEDSLLIAGSAGLQATMNKALWFWQDLFNFYLPKAVGMLKDIPIPRSVPYNPDCRRTY